MFVYYYDTVEDKFKVGFYDPKKDFICVKKTDSEREAQELVSFLNGGVKGWSS